MSFEVEQKYRTPGHADVSARLDRMGATAGPTIDQQDHYLNHPSRNFAKTNEAFRLRKVGGENFVTYKGPKREGSVKTREEVEVGFAPGPEALAKMLRVYEALGFRPVAVVRKARTPYRLTARGRTVEVVLDVAEGVGTFVEVETIAADEADVAGAQEAVVELAAALGLTDLEPRSYLRMALEQRDGAGR